MTERGDEPHHSAAEESQDLEISEVVEGLPEEAKNEIVKRTFRAEASYYRAPVPSPSMLQGYEDVVPGSAKQIMDQANEQSSHRMRLEEMTVRAGVENSRRGQWFGFFIALAVIATGAVAVLTGAGVIGLALILPGLASLVGVFVYSQRLARAELEESRAGFPQVQGQAPTEYPQIERGSEDSPDQQGSQEDSDQSRENGS